MLPARLSFQLFQAGVHFFSPITTAYHNFFFPARAKKLYSRENDLVEKGIWINGKMS